MCILEEIKEQYLIQRAHIKSKNEILNEFELLLRKYKTMHLKKPARKRNVNKNKIIKSKNSLM